MPNLKSLHIGGLLSPIVNKGFKKIFFNPTDTMISSFLRGFSQTILRLDLAESSQLTDKMVKQFTLSKYLV